MPPDGRLTFRETDEAGKATATYIYSKQDAPAPGTASIEGRVDEMGSAAPSSSWSTKPLVASLRDVFLPSGYPQSVSDDYLPYQIFDSLQAFCSSIAGLLSSRAVLQGVGVGNANASPTSALLLHILQDTSGRIATILFAHRAGTALEPECKTYRLAADVFNDIAMILDCLSPMIPAGVMRVSILSTAGVLRALCGVAGGSSKASLSAHFAKWGNLAELNAKDSSQETIISLLGMLVGSVVVSHVTGFKTTWAALLTLLVCHLALNYAAVRSVQMTSLNRHRANIAFSAILDSDPDLDLDALRQPNPGPKDISHKTKSKSQVDSPPSRQHSYSILTPAQVAEKEHIFPRDSALQWQHQHLGTAAIGVSLPTFCQTARRASFHTPIPMASLRTLFEKESYILFLFPGNKAAAGTEWHASILLLTGCTVRCQLKAWLHALLAARVLCASGARVCDIDSVVDAVSATLSFLNDGARFEGYLAALVGAGWEVDIAALETRGGRRMSFV